MPVDLLLLHQGVVPNVNLAMPPASSIAGTSASSAWSRCSTRIAATSVAGIAVAGDGAGIAGAAAAAERGRLAAHRARCSALEPDAPQRADRAGACRQRARSARSGPRLPRHALPAGRRVPHAARATRIVCRCEEVTAGADPRDRRARLRPARTR